MEVGCTESTLVGLLFGVLNFPDPGQRFPDETKQEAKEEAGKLAAEQAAGKKASEEAAHMYFCLSIPAWRRDSSNASKKS